MQCLKIKQVNLYSLTQKDACNVLLNQKANVNSKISVLQNTYKYKVTSYYSLFGGRPQGIESSEQFNSFDEAMDFVHECISTGSYVEIENQATGGTYLLDYDRYFADFEGEFPINEDDLEEPGYYTLEDKYKDEIER